MTSRGALAIGASALLHTIKMDIRLRTTSSCVKSSYMCSAASFNPARSWESSMYTTHLASASFAWANIRKREWPGKSTASTIFVEPETGTIQVDWLGFNDDTWTGANLCRKHTDRLNRSCSGELVQQGGFAAAALAEYQHLLPLTAHTATDQGSPRQCLQ
mmetsp:Transcript_19098/g.48401  ORF Transcript_19098/g.48401 Transcript_19098/m.48401 type:complete len:160 (-) Transcript_19098:152-631(-)